MTVSLDEFDLNWRRLLDCMNTHTLTSDNLKGRYLETWKNFRRRVAGSWERAVDHYIETAGEDPWFPTPGQLIAVADRIALDVAGAAEALLTAEDKARLRREMDEWLAGPEVKSLERKILGVD